MEQDEATRSHDRVRILAEAVSLPIADARIPALAHAFEAALEMVEGVESLAETGGAEIGEPYDPVWREEGARS